MNRKMGQLKRIVKLEDEVAKLKTAIRIIGEAVDKLDTKTVESPWQKLIKNITQKTTKSEKTS